MLPFSRCISHMMYRLNTLFAHFACNPQWGNMLVNSTWYRYEPQGNRAVCFTKDQMEQFMAFARANPLHFPGPHFQVLCTGEDFEIPLGVHWAKSRSAPLFDFIQRPTRSRCQG